MTGAVAAVQHPKRVHRASLEAFRQERGDCADAMVRLGFIEVIEEEHNNGD
jgi:hypothetical protein